MGQIHSVARAQSALPVTGGRNALTNECCEAERLRPPRMDGRKRSRYPLGLAARPRAWRSAAGCAQMDEEPGQDPVVVSLRTRIAISIAPPLHRSQFRWSRMTFPEGASGVLCAVRSLPRLHFLRCESPLRFRMDTQVTMMEDRPALKTDLPSHPR